MGDYVPMPLIGRTGYNCREMVKKNDIAENPEVLEIIVGLLEQCSEKEQRIRQLETRVKVLESAKNRGDNSPRARRERLLREDSPDKETPQGILIVEHSDIMKVLLRGFLVAHRLEVVGTVSDAEQALRAFTKCKPVIVTVEVDMPGMNGFELTMEIKDRYPEIKVILFSMEGGRELVRKAQQCGADEFFTKPINSKHLLKVIKEYVVYGYRQVEIDQFGNAVLDMSRLLE